MKWLLHAGFPLLTLIGALALASPAGAQDGAIAEALFNRGMADMEAGRYDTGCKAIAESERLDPRPGTLFTLAVCEERWGHLASAVTHYGDYLLVYERLTDDRKATQGDRPGLARAAKERLAPDVPELTLLLPPNAPAGTIVRRDGQVMTNVTLGVGLPADPGDHIVSTQAPGGAPWELRFTIGKGEKKKVLLQVPVTPRVDPRPAPPVLPAPLPPGGYYAWPPPAPREIEWEPGQPVPDGYRPATQIRSGVVIGGAVTLGTVWFFNVLAAALTVSVGGSEAGPLFAPVVGPFIAIETLHANSAAIWLAIDGVVQTTGAVMLIAGIAARRPVLLRKDVASKVWLTPAPMMLGNGTVGFGIRGAI